MRNLIVRVIVNMIALWVAAWLIGGITLSTNLGEWLLVAVVFGLVNAFIKPIIKLFTLPINLATLGLFTIVINAFLLLLTAWLVPGLSFEDGVFGNVVNALLASIVISIVSMILNWFLKD
jgi:putative membrane protein